MTDEESSKSWEERWNILLEENLAISFHDLSVIVDRILNGGGQIHDLIESVSSSINEWVREGERDKAIQGDLERARELLQKK